MVMDLSEQFQGNKKDNFSVSQYIVKAKIIVSQLPSVGEPLHDKNMLLYLMRGLGSRYRSFTTNNRMRKTLPSINIFHTLLEGYKRSLKKDELCDHSQIYQANVTRFQSKNYVNSGDNASAGFKNKLEYNKGDFDQNKMNLKNFLQ